MQHVAPGAGADPACRVGLAGCLFAWVALSFFLSLSDAGGGVLAAFFVVPTTFIGALVAPLARSGLTTKVALIEKIARLPHDPSCFVGAVRAEL